VTDASRSGEPIARFCENTNISDLSHLKSIAEASMMDMGITFNVYSDLKEQVLFRFPEQSTRPTGDAY
jgi:hypothetical protein